ncbi:DUF2812 domain-containing protein [Evansella sp. LMS18]|uniref:DUF2812 domain-containing protein n=1 Tax=Evansella sp. LMS18 TaxID=2924033 RepID=UPI0020D11D39|nr:DUF2812 domain-containing protein [Evansella sp. LMS18]UTR10405.1 DUF2812 domain-containing protein [Evansella sp. LMS18]
MDKKVFRPLWSFDVPKTETWLSDMTEQGYHLYEFRKSSSTFLFKQGSPGRAEFKIGLDKKKSGVLPDALVNDGWRMVSSKGAWYAAVNEQPQEQIKTSIVQDNIVKRNQKLFYLFISILVFLTVWMFNFVMDYMWMQSLPEAIQEHLRDTGGMVTNPLVIFPGIIINVLLISLLAYFLNTIRNSNKQLTHRNSEEEDLEHGVVEGQELIPFEEETSLKKEGKLVVKRYFGWKYAPDKLEKRLEEMEAKGFQLYRISWSGISFYFLSGSPRRVSYNTEFQNMPDERSAGMHKEAGWKQAYSSASTFPKWRIWSQEYSSDGAKPVLYSDQPTKQKQAWKMAINSTFIFIPVIVLYSFYIWTDINLASESMYYSITWPVIIIFSIIVILFCSFTIRSWLYYFRMKKIED